jgi:hypothetical protein
MLCQKSEVRSQKAKVKIEDTLFKIRVQIEVEGRHMIKDEMQE